jgi:hypothetical protein
MEREKLRGILANSWLFGALTRATKSAYTGALYEFLYLVLWSVFPFALGGLVLYVIANEADKSLVSVAIGTFRNGELLVFTISLLAPMLFLVLHDPHGAGPFPHKLPLSTIGMFVIVFCAALFSLQKAQTVKDPDFVFQLSLWLTGLAMFFRYLAMVYHRVRMPEPNERVLRAPEEDFVDEVRKHLDGN